MVDESIDRSERHGWIDENVTPLRERRVGGDRDAFALVSFGDQFEQHRRFGLIAAHVRQIVEDDQIEAIELGELLRQPQVAPRSLKALY